MAGMAVRIDDVQKAIRQLDEAFVRNVAAGDIQRMVDEFYSPDAVVLPPGSPRVTGREAIVAFWTGMIGMGISNVTLQTAEVSASGDLAYGLGWYGLTIGGARQVGKFVVVYRRREDGSYRAVVDSFSADA